MESFRGRSGRASGSSIIEEFRKADCGMRIAECGMKNLKTLRPLPAPDSSRKDREVRILGPLMTALLKRKETKEVMEVEKARPISYIA